MPSAIKRALVGTVTDTTHEALENVRVTIGSPRRDTKTNAQGRFTIKDLDPGVYEVRFYRIGYTPVVRPYIVTDSGNVARVCLVPRARALPTVNASATRLGLSGLIGDSTHKPLPGAEVRVIGAGMHVLTDSAGAFHLPVPKGTYPVWVSKPGFGRQLVSVTIPPDSGREIIVWLGSPGPESHGLAARIDAMRERILWAQPNRSALVSAEQIARSGASLSGILVSRAKATVNEICPASIDGTALRIPLYMIDKADVAMMEIYLQGTPRNYPTSIHPSATGDGKTMAAGRRSSGPPSGNQCGHIVVWLKR